MRDGPRGLSRAAGFTLRGLLRGRGLLGIAIVALGLELLHVRSGHTLRVVLAVALLVHDIVPVLPQTISNGRPGLRVLDGLLAQLFRRLFLDEIGEMAFDLQAKLLRILETGEFLKIGDTKPVKVNVRVIAATNRDLAKEIADGHFREDLFYRLSVFHIHLPPLRERVDDIPLHVEAFVSALSSKIGKTIRTISPDYVRILKRYPWKGNVRELRNVVERSLIISDGDTLTADTLPLTIQNPQDNTDSSYSGFDLDGVEKMHIQKVLKYTNGNKTETSRLLGIGLTTLYRKIEEYGL